MEPQRRANMLALNDWTFTHSRIHPRNNDGTSTNSSTQIQTKRIVKSLPNILRCVWTGSVHTSGHVQIGHGQEQTHQNTGTEFFPRLWEYRQRSISLPWENRNRTVSVLWANSERTESGMWAYRDRKTKRTESGLWEYYERTVSVPRAECERTVIGKVSV